MKNPFVSIILAGIVILVVSLGMLYASVYVFSSVTDEYYNQVFRSNSYGTDMLFYIHPFVLAGALYWFWDHSKTQMKGSLLAQAVMAALVYGVVALVPVLLLTFSAINVSATMVFTWLGYGVVQAFCGLLVIAKNHPA